jgi:molecular chaperone DnaK (HSP70)
MKLGVDFGTTRVVAAVVDRGNYPVVSFEAPDGAMRDWYPPLAAVNGNERLFGWDAWYVQTEPEWTVIRSIKRLLADAGPRTRVEFGDQTIHLGDALAEMVIAFKTALLEKSTLPQKGRETLEVMLGVPANANSNQRFLTVDAFRQAGFQVLGLLNEPSAAAVEFAHRGDRGVATIARMLVYDLGGGTFDASLVESEEFTHTIVATESIATLGGDDFDAALADLALETAGVSSQERDNLTQAEWFRLHEECRQKKESLHPNTRRIVVDLESVRSEWSAVPVPVADFYDRCRPLIDETMHAVEDLLESNGGGDQPLEVLYVTGGGSELPLVPRALRERFGRNVKRSQYTRLATAIGLAIQADPAATAERRHVLREKFTRYFGVWREADAGHSVRFDPLFSKGASLPAPGEPNLEIQREYESVHNIGHFRYLECSHLDSAGRPAGDITVWDEIRFPFSPRLKDRPDLSSDVVVLSEPQPIEELYSCDAGGTLRVTIANRAADYDRTYRLGHWRESSAGPAIKPGRKKRSRKNSASG